MSDFAGIPIVVCPHVPKNTVWISQEPFDCPLCMRAQLDAVPHGAGARG